MNRFVAPLLVALSVSGLAASLPVQAQTVTESTSVGSTDFYRSMINSYRDRIAKMSPKERAEFMAMLDKMMAMEADHKVQLMKMEADQKMAMAKMAMAFETERMKMMRELDLWLLSGGR